jgi:ribosome biogenesis GTPase
MILVATVNPDYNLKLIDRIVISAELNNLNPIICVNKIDLIDLEEIREDFRIYQDHGIDVHFISVYNKINLQALLDALNGKEVALIGQSGVGKSTLVNWLFASELQKTNEISSFNFKGKHTTSFVKMFDYNFDNKIEFKIVDSPGIKEFGIWGLEKSDLPFYFKEFEDYSISCKFQPCTHTHEPGCAVIQAVEDEKIRPIRYQSYLNILDSLE